MRRTLGHSLAQNAGDRRVFWLGRSCCTARAWSSFLPLLQEVSSIYKTRNQLEGKRQPSVGGELRSPARPELRCHDLWYAVHVSVEHGPSALRSALWNRPGQRHGPGIARRRSLVVCDVAPCACLRLPLRGPTTPAPMASHLPRRWRPVLQALQAMPHDVDLRHTVRAIPATR
jgi:hypothetical protein